MSKRLEDLAFKYNINASVDELSLFVSEVYNDGYNAGKKKQEPMTGSEISQGFSVCYIGNVIVHISASAEIEEVK